MKIISIFMFLMVFFPIYGAASSESLIPLQKVQVNIRDKASLLRGEKIYINFCLGCHSMAFLRYNRAGRDLGLTDQEGRVDKALLKKEFILTGAKVSDPILSAISKIDAKEWFGVIPPDLTLVARIRGADWLYTYLRSFYQNSKKTFGTNNLVFPDVAMPNVLESLQGIQRPIYKEKLITINGVEKKIKVVDHLALVKEGSMDPKEFDTAMRDLVNFMVYASAPERAQREAIGVWVILFLLIFAVVTYLLKKEYWRDIHTR